MVCVRIFISLSFLSSSLLQDVCYALLLYTDVGRCCMSVLFAFPFLLLWDSGRWFVPLRVELEISCADDLCGRYNISFGQTPVVLLSQYEHAAFQALRFLQGVYGFVVSDKNYEAMVSYRELSRSTMYVSCMADTWYVWLYHVDGGYQFPWQAG